MLTGHASSTLRDSAQLQGSTCLSTCIVCHASFATEPKRPTSIILMEQTLLVCVVSLLPFTVKASVFPSCRSSSCPLVRRKITRFAWQDEALIFTLDHSCSHSVQTLEFDDEILNKKKNEKKSNRTKIIKNSLG